jgi:hypothetical protein
MRRIFSTVLALSSGLCAEMHNLTMMGITRRRMLAEIS